MATVETVEGLIRGIDGIWGTRGLPPRSAAEVLAWCEQDAYGWLVHEVGEDEQVKGVLGIVVVPDADVKRDATAPTTAAEARWPDKSMLATKWTNPNLKHEDRIKALELELKGERLNAPFGFHPDSFAPLPSPIMNAPQGDADTLAFGDALSVFTFDRQQDPLGPTADDPPVRYIIILMAQLTGYFFPIYPLLVYRPGLTPLPLFFYPLPAPGIILRQTGIGNEEIDTFPGLAAQLRAEIQQRHRTILGEAVLAGLLEPPKEIPEIPPKKQIVVYASELLRDATYDTATLHDSPGPRRIFDCAHQIVLVLDLASDDRHGAMRYLKDRATGDLTLPVELTEENRVEVERHLHFSLS